MTLKLADFGLCLSMREERAVTRAGTLDYMPPEVIACPTKDLPEDNKDRFDLAYGLGADIWSIGVLAYELINGIPPFTRHERQDTEELIMSGSLPSFLSPVSSELKDFVYSCLVESCLRPSAAFCLKHSWITGVAEPGRKVRDRRQTSTDGLSDLANFSDRGSQLKRERVPEEDEQLPETRSTSPINLLSPDPLAKPQIPALQLERQWESPILAAASKQSIESEIDEDPSSSSMMIRRFMAEGFRSAAASPTLIGQRFVNRDNSNDEFEVPDI
jgi:serine/threonine protein kinase